MKKEYFQPSIKIVKVKMASLICLSGVNSPGKGIGYGGVDEDGEKSADSRFVDWDFNEDWD